MRLAPWRIGAILVCALSVALPAFADDKEKDKGGKDRKEIAWAKTFAAAVKEAKKADKPIMVDFYTDWCGWCKKLDADTYPDPKVVGTAEKFVSVKLDAEDKAEGQKTYERYKSQIEGFPTILFLNADAIDLDKDKAARGEVVGKIVGYMTAEPFAAEMKKHAETYTKVAAARRELPDLKAKYEKDGKDLANLGKLIVAYHDRGDADKARDLLKAGEALDADNAKGCLTKAYSAVADDYQSDAMEALEGHNAARATELFDKAIPLFQKAARTGKDPADVYYARSSIAACYLSEGKIKEGYKELKAALKIEGAPADEKKQGEELIQRIEQFMKQRGMKIDD